MIEIFWVGIAIGTTLGTLSTVTVVLVRALVQECQPYRRNLW